MKRQILKMLATGLLLALPAIANAATNGFATTNVNMRSGPSTRYPAVVVVPAGAPIVIHGCLNNVNWCDVSFARGRGWVSGSYIQAATSSAGSMSIRNIIARSASRRSPSTWIPTGSAITATVTSTASATAGGAGTTGVMCRRRRAITTAVAMIRSAIPTATARMAGIVTRTGIAWTTGTATTTAAATIVEIRAASGTGGIDRTAIGTIAVMASATVGGGKRVRVPTTAAVRRPVSMDVRPTVRARRPDAEPRSRSQRKLCISRGVPPRLISPLRPHDLFAKRTPQKPRSSKAGATRV